MKLFVIKDGLAKEGRARSRKVLAKDESAVVLLEQAAFAFRTKVAWGASGFVDSLTP